MHRDFGLESFRAFFLQAALTLIALGIVPISGGLPDPHLVTPGANSRIGAKSVLMQDMQIGEGTMVNVVSLVITDAITPLHESRGRAGKEAFHAESGWRGRPHLIPPGPAVCSGQGARPPLSGRGKEDLRSGSMKSLPIKKLHCRAGRGKGAR